MPSEVAATSDLVRDVRSYLLASAEVKRASAEECSGDVLRAALLIVKAFQGSGKLLLCGNGGSAADCQHIAAEFVSALTQDFRRRALPAIALSTDTSFLTANANDFGFENVFVRQVEALVAPGDVILGISTSGNSTNVIRAMEYGRSPGARCIALTGASGGGMAAHADVALAVPSRSTQHIQEAHIAIAHALCALVERLLFSPGAAEGRG
jgi:phosphoheptose isomerase